LAVASGLSGIKSQLLGLRIWFWKFRISRCLGGRWSARFSAFFETSPGAENARMASGSKSALFRHDHGAYSGRRICL